MPIKFNCYQCGAKLRVPEAHIGKKARCPKCDTKNVVPATSQRDSQSGLGENLEDMGNFLDPPLAAPASLPPAMATPVTPASPLPSAPVASGSYSPYAAPVQRKKSMGSAASGSVMQPIYEARTMMQLWGWVVFIIGILYCLTIFGAIVGWLFIWMGWLIKGAAEAVTIGVESGDKSQLQLASQRIGTFFKILGVLAIIWLSIMLLYLLAVVALVVFGLIGAAAA